MDIVNMETRVTSDMRKKFAQVTIAMFSIVTKDIQDFAVGSRSMVDVNLHHFVNINTKRLQVLKK